MYIETTIPSYYYEIRTEPESITKRERTKEWWDNHRQDYELVISPAVMLELERGNYPTKTETLTLVQDLLFLEINEVIEEIVVEYIAHKLMPRASEGDALHLALASYYRCQFLLTWNCKHLANANKYEHIRHINTLLGLFVPTITTPFELMYKEML